MDRVDRPQAQALLAELGFQARLTIYLASAPGAGKTYRLLSDAVSEMRSGRRVAIGWIETKNRPDVTALASELPRIPPRRYGSFDEFDLEAALASNYETIVLDELAHTNAEGAVHAKRWQDALALRAGGKSVLGAFNIQHLDSVAPVAERIIGYPIREIVPLSFVRAADGAIALDVSSAVLESRLAAGRIVRDDDVARASIALFRPATLDALRALLLQTVDQLTIPVISPASVSTALAAIDETRPLGTYLRRVKSLADALDLALEVASPEVVSQSIEEDVRAVEASIIEPPPGFTLGRLEAARAALVAVPNGRLAQRMVGRAAARDIFVADPLRAPAPSVQSARHIYGQSAGDRLRIGYGKLMIYLGSVAGSGKTYAMLDRAQSLRADGVDVVAGLVETHGRVETAAKLVGLEVIPRLPDGELDRDAIVQRRPSVVLVDELAHTNREGATFRKRFDDVIALLRLGMSVITTLNVQHLVGLSDAVLRLTGTVVRETLPDAILELADEVIFIDVTPDVLRERLRAGKIYPAERIEAALANFFRVENLAALRELTVRELLRARRERASAPPFARIVLGVRARRRETALIERVATLAMRLPAALAVVHVRERKAEPGALDALANATRTVHGAWSIVEGDDPVAGLVAACAPGDVPAVEGSRATPRPFVRTFAERLLRAGAAELLVLAPRG